MTGTAGMSHLYTVNSAHKTAAAIINVRNSGPNLRRHVRSEMTYTMLTST